MPPQNAEFVVDADVLVHLTVRQIFAIHVVDTVF